MKNKPLIVATLLGLFSLMHATWHEWSAKMEHSEKTSSEKLTEKLIRERNDEIEQKKIRMLSRKIEMCQFRLGQFDPSSSISKLPLDLINRIHFCLKKIKT